jgi:putative nucleotidyltransferase with HDIG domain
MRMGNGTGSARRVTIAPQEIGVEAPATLVRTIIGSCDFASLPGASYEVRLLAREDHRVVASFFTRHEPQHGHTLKEVTIHHAGRFTFRHLTGPFEGAVEELRLFPTAGGARLLVGAEFEAGEGSLPRLLKLSFEHAVQRYLRDVKRVAESRLQPLSVADAPFTLVVPVPAIIAEDDLVEAIGAQEEAEWGHVGHGRGVERVALSLAEAVMLPSRQIEHLRRAALLHDAGKIALDSALWGTRSTLAPSQRAMMEAHAQLGHDLAARIGAPDAVTAIILHHHERWDGKGYPARLHGDAIPLRARILFLAEAIDSMLRATYRRSAMTPAETAAALEAGAGTLWDPMLARKAARIVRGR